MGTVRHSQAAGDEAPPRGLVPPQIMLKIGRSAIPPGTGETRRAESRITELESI